MEDLTIMEDLITDHIEEEAEADYMAWKKIIIQISYMYRRIIKYKSTEKSVLLYLEQYEFVLS